MATVDMEAQAGRGDPVAQVRLSECLEREGRHFDALTWLSRAAKTGDIGALTRLGLKLVTGKNTPFRPVDGARLLADAARAGGAEAAGHLAVLVGGGLYVGQSWSAALDWLQRSAELGSAPAQAQLRILAARPDGDSWRDLRRAVDLDRWITPAPAAALSSSPRVTVLGALASPAACGWIIDQARERLVRAEVYDPRSGRAVITQRTRTNRIALFSLVETHLLNVILQARLAASAGVALKQLETFAVLHYAEGEEHDDHYDYLDPAEASYAAEIARMGQRVMTCLVYLNGDYEGGETEFPKLGLKHTGRMGDGLVFSNVAPTGAPDPGSLHAGRPPRRGEKWVVSQFVRSRSCTDIRARQAG